MKKLILTTTFLVAGILGSLAQGVVNFNNISFNYGDGIDRSVYKSAIGVDPVDDATWTAQLVENGTPVGPAQHFFGAALPGSWQFVNVTLNTAGGQPTSLAVQIADGSGTVLATSPSFDYTPPSSATAPPEDFLMFNFRAFAVPEPSTIALGVLGLGALLLFRRRK